MIVAANLMIAVGEGGFGLLVLLGNPRLWQMIVLETMTGAGMAGVFYPASQALLPRLVPDRLLQEASAMSRLAMNAAQMAGAAIAGVFVAATGPGWALATCGIGMLGTVPLLLAIRAPGAVRTQSANVLRELRDGWSAFASRRWLWATTIQYCVVLAAWYGAFDVLGPVVAREHLGGAAAWGLIAAADAVGLIIGGVIALRLTVHRPILFVVLIGATCAITPLALAALLPLPLICLAAVGLGIALEVMMVQWTVTMTRNVPPDLLARVSAYDIIGSVSACPSGRCWPGRSRRDRGLGHPVRCRGADRRRLGAHPARARGAAHARGAGHRSAGTRGGVRRGAGGLAGGGLTSGPSVRRWQGRK